MRSVTLERRLPAQSRLLSGTTTQHIPDASEYRNKCYGLASASPSPPMRPTRRRPGGLGARRGSCRGPGIESGPEVRA